MMRSLMWFMAGAATLAILLCGSGFLFLKTRAHGFSARAQPTVFETFAAETARALALPASAREEQNPVPISDEVIAEAAAHWADHCATCHGNDGSGQIPMSQQMYPPAPDMRKDSTQKKTDGELFYIIENGIRLSGMPAWGGSKAGEQASWKLVHFIRHLPHLSADEIGQMEKLNSKSPDEIRQEQEEEQFLNGETPAEAPKQHRH
jgi:mono/diheme cytochrome c family protein